MKRKSTENHCDKVEETLTVSVNGQRDENLL